MPEASTPVGHEPLPAPLAPPTTAAPLVLASQGRLLVTERNARLPDRCIKCNAENPRRMKVTLRWHHPALYLILLSVLVIALVGLIIYAIVTRVVSRTSNLDIGLCKKHVMLRRMHILIATLLCLLSLPTFIVAAAQESLGLLGLGGLLLFGGLLYGVLFVPLLKPKYIGLQHAWVKGCGAAYLAELEETNIQPPAV